MTIVTTQIQRGNTVTNVSSYDTATKKSVPVSSGSSSSSKSSSGGGGGGSSSSKPTYTVTDTATGKEVGTYEFGGTKARVEGQLQDRAKAILGMQGGSAISRNYEDVKGSISQRQAAEFDKAKSVQTGTSPMPDSMPLGGLALSQAPQTATRQSAMQYNPITGAPMTISTAQSTGAVSGDKIKALLSTQTSKNNTQDAFAKSLLGSTLTGTNKSTPVQGTSVPSFATPLSIQERQQQKVQKAQELIIGKSVEAGLSQQQGATLASEFAKSNNILNVLDPSNKLFIEKTSTIETSPIWKSGMPEVLSSKLDFSGKSTSQLTSPLNLDIVKKIGGEYVVPGQNVYKTQAEQLKTTGKITLEKSPEAVRQEVSEFDRAQAEMQSFNRAKAQYENTKIRQAELNSKIEQFNAQSPLDRDPNVKKQLDEESKAIEQQFSMNPNVVKTAEGNYQFSGEYTVPKVPESQQTASARFSEGEVTAASLGYKLRTQGADKLSPTEIERLQKLSEGKDVSTRDKLAYLYGSNLGAFRSGTGQVIPMVSPTEAGRTAAGTGLQKVTGIQDAETAKILAETLTKGVGYAALGGVAGAVGKGVGSLAGSARLGAGAGATTGVTGKTIGAVGSVASKLATPAQVAYAGIGAYESGKAASEGYQEGGALRGLAAGAREAQKYVGADYLLTKGVTGAGIGYSEKLAQRGVEVSKATNLDFSQGKTKGVVVQVEGRPTFVEQVSGSGTIRAKAGDIFEQKVPYTYGFTGAGQPITESKLLTTGEVRVIPKGQYQNEFILRGKSTVGTPETTFSRNVISSIRTNPQTQRTLTRSVLTKEGAKARELQETRSLREGQNIFTQGRTTRVSGTGKPQEMGFFSSSTTLQEPRVLMSGDETLQTTAFSTQEAGVSGGGRAIDDYLGNIATRSPLTDYSGLPTVELTATRTGTKTIDLTKAAEEGATTATKADTGTMDVLNKVSVEPKSPLAPSGAEDIRVIRTGGSSKAQPQPKQVQVTREAEALQTSRQQPSFTQAGSAQDVKSIIGQRSRVVDFTKPYRAEGQYISKALAQAENLVKIPVMGRSLAEQESRLSNMSRLQLQPQVQQSQTTRMLDTAQETKLISDIGQTQSQLPETIQTQDQGSILKQTSDTSALPFLAPVALAPIFGGGGGFNVGGFGRGFSGYSGERTTVGSSIKVNKLQELELGKNIEKFL